ncbi:hypothetical protein MIT9_P1951 [Methylomarinovum caldicuralii]|uniref:Rhodanese domain-containing protein n=1 Tax=Methylomarinovum caldicuralii TaxID=438856 RepID=A0AAU9C566_9GAMM|nr:rhodanese-like domain-containing protein [Methylomarinovum caldicuralii]BCX82365.1 hypothetical protein MIT9_P1951 [Methylomarinovum caldicuralii]
MSEILNLKPPAAWQFMQEHPDAVLIDVRTTCEHLFVGRPVGAVLVPLKDGLPMQSNPNFVPSVKEIVPDPATPILFLCRSGHRSLEAARLMAAEGYQTLVNIDEGFEGPLDADKHRSTLGGWRFHGLPWEQN